MSKQENTIFYAGGHRGKLIYVLELKLNGFAQEALNQILQKNYLQPYAADPRRKMALGISFSSDSCKVAEYLVETY